nr:hypothetical protein [uncultured Carboxylicivirga sp.]
MKAINWKWKVVVIIVLLIISIVYNFIYLKQPSVTSFLNVAFGFLVSNLVGLGLYKAQGYKEYKWIDFWLILYVLFTIGNLFFDFSI